MDQAALVRVSSKRLATKAKNYTELLAGALKGVYGQTKEEIDVYVRKERETWEKRGFQR